MPVPKPKQGESKDDFVSRCMHEVSKNKDRTNEQNIAICLSQWRDKDKKTVQLPTLYRSARIASGSINETTRSVSFTFSSSRPVKRGVAGALFHEVLSHAPGAIDDGRLKNGVVPLLWNHDWNQQIGRVTQYAVQDGKGYATAELSPNANGMDMLRDIVAGIKTSVSVGYIPKAIRCLRKRKRTTDGADNTKLRGFDSNGDFDLLTDDDDDQDVEAGDGDYNEDDDDEFDTYEVARWEPIEISIVSVPADPGVGIGRSNLERTMYTVRMLDEVSDSAKVNLEVEPRTAMPTEAEIASSYSTPGPTGNNMFSPPAQPAVTIEREDVGKVRENELVRIRELDEYGRWFNAKDEAQDYIRSGKSIAEFEHYLLHNKARSSAPISTVSDMMFNVGQRDRNRYSITRAIRTKMKAQQGEGRFDGLEAEISQEIARVQQKDPQGFFMPDWALNGVISRDLTATPPPAGGGGAGYTIQTTVEPSLIPLLRNRTAVLQAGARYISGLQGNLQMPRQRAASTITWNTETAALTESDLTLDAITLSPNRVGGWCNYSKQLLAQSSLDIDNIVRDDMIQVIQIAIDAAALNGTGTNQPTGLLNTTANAPATPGPSYDYSKTAPSITFTSGYPTWTSVVNFEGNVEAGNLILDANACYLTTPSVKAAWKTYAKSDPRQTTSFFPSFYWEGGRDGEVNGYRAIATNQVPANKVVFGKWDELMIGQWAGLDIVVDIYSLAAQALIRVITNMFVDIKYRYASAFCYSTNSGISN